MDAKHRFHTLSVHGAASNNARLDWHTDKLMQMTMFVLPRKKTSILPTDANEDDFQARAFQQRHLVMCGQGAKTADALQISISFKLLSLFAICDLPSINERQFGEAPPN